MCVCVCAADDLPKKKPPALYKPTNPDGLAYLDFSVSTTGMLAGVQVSSALILINPAIVPHTHTQFPASVCLFATIIPFRSEEYRVQSTEQNKSVETSEDLLTSAYETNTNQLMCKAATNSYFSCDSNQTAETQIGLTIHLCILFLVRLRVLCFSIFASLPPDVP